jgi:hypothetical protein
VDVGAIRAAVLCGLHRIFGSFEELFLIVAVAGFGRPQADRESQLAIRDGQ